jgi:prepilin-type N-terminal cleavage/methylation domain-containing protein
VRAGRQKGFTLVEVCLVMLIFGIAISSLMALFPVSLRQGNMAVSDSVVTTFGDAVMNAIAGRASSLQEEGDWSIWKSEQSFQREVLRGLTIDTSGSPEGGGDPLRSGENVVRDYLGIGRMAGNKKSGVVNIKYRLDIEHVNASKFGRRLYRAILHVSDNEYANVTDTGAVFVTYLFYAGEVPLPEEESE